MTKPADQERLLNAGVRALKQWLRTSGHGSRPLAKAKSACQMASIQPLHGDTKLAEIKQSNVLNYST
jgi:hypothetical protein